MALSNLGKALRLVVKDGYPSGSRALLSVLVRLPGQGCLLEPGTYLADELLLRFQAGGEGFHSTLLLRHRRFQLLHPAVFLEKLIQ